MNLSNYSLKHKVHHAESLRIQIYRQAGQQVDEKVHVNPDLCRPKVLSMVIHLLIIPWPVTAFLLTWLWSGNGMIDAQTPNIIDGWISQWVYVEQYAWPFSTNSSGVMATITVSSSLTSMYSTIPPATRSCQLIKTQKEHSLLVGYDSYDADPVKR